MLMHTRHFLPRRGPRGPWMARRPQRAFTAGVGEGRLSQTSIRKVSTVQIHLLKDSSPQGTAHEARTREVKLSVDTSLNHNLIKLSAIKFDPPQKGHWEPLSMSVKGVGKEKLTHLWPMRQLVDHLIVLVHLGDQDIDDLVWR